MIKVSFFDNVDDRFLKFAVVISEYHGKWVCCRHKNRDSYEVPGGRREQGETILQTAERELYEETGAVRYDIRPVCVYSVIGGGEETFGMLYYAQIHEFSKLPSFEIERIEFFERLPGRLTYPFIQPHLFYRARKVINGRTFPYVIWDWNGTLVDDADVALNSVNDMLQKRGMPLLDKSFYLKNCTTPIINFYRKIFDLSVVPFEDILKEFNEGYHVHIKKAGLMPGAAGILDAFKRQGVTQIVLSSSAQKELLTFAARFNVQRYFSEILGAQDYYSESKAQRAVSFMSDNYIDPNDVVVIGDTIHDFEIADAIKAECILISNGHQGKDELSRCGKIVLDDISDLSLYI